MEATVLVAPEVQKEFERFELAALFTDGHTPAEDANGLVQAQKFGSAVIPAYYAVDLDGKVLARQEGAASLEDFTTFLRSALPR
jgi:hypothetical protein